MRTFRKKILLEYGASLLLITAVLSWAMFLILRLGRASESILRQNYQSIQAAENMIDAVGRQDAATLLVLLGNEPQGASEFRENGSLFLQWLGRAQDNITIPGAKEIVNTPEEGYARYVSEISNLQLLYRSDRAKAANAYHEVVLPLFRSILDTCIKRRDLNHGTMYAASNRANRISVQAVFSISLSGAARHYQVAMVPM